MSIAAYKQTIRESETPRQIERRVLSRITAEMDEIGAEYDTALPGRKQHILSQGLRASLGDNQSLWRALRYDLAADGNRLPVELRASLISLALWIDRQSTKVMGGEPGLAAIVEVNKRVIAGLSGQAPRPDGV